MEHTCTQIIKSLQFMQGWCLLHSVTQVGLQYSYCKNCMFINFGKFHAYHKYARHAK